MSNSEQKVFKLNTKQKCLDLLNLGILPNQEDLYNSGLSSAEALKLWFEGQHRQAAIASKQYRDEFAKRGPGSQWFCNWKPQTKEEENLADEIDEAIHIVESMYQRLYDATVNGRIKPEDMILQVDGRGKSEGIRAKKGAYNENCKISIVGVVGDSNFDPTDGTIEFEDGSRSFRLVLAYPGPLPTTEALIQDICYYPLILEKRKLGGKDGFYDEGEINSKNRFIPYHTGVGVCFL